MDRCPWQDLHLPQYHQMFLPHLQILYLQLQTSCQTLAVVFNVFFSLKFAKNLLLCPSTPWTFHYQTLGLISSTMYKTLRCPCIKWIFSTFVFCFTPFTGSICVVHGPHQSIHLHVVHFQYVDQHCVPYIKSGKTIPTCFAFFTKFV